MTNNTGFILNLITLSINIFTCLILFIIWITIIHHVWYKLLKHEDRTIVILSANIYMIISFFTGILVSFNIQTLLGDLYKHNFNSSWCIFIGYLHSVIGGGLYWSFVNQGFFRLCRIVYSTRRWLQNVWLYIILPPVELILVGILLCPILIWHGVVYLPEEYYCYAPYTDLRSILYVILSTYGIPLLFLSLIDLRITRFLRQQSNTQTVVAVKQRQQRDILVLRRIFIIVGVLMIVGIPLVVFVIMFIITGESDPVFKRIIWFTMALSMAGLNFAMIIVTPQLKSIVFQKFQQNRIMQVNFIVPRSIQIQQNTATL